MPVLSPTERMVKCPTAHCPGWIAVDSHRPQTVPCRYCRVTVHTLAYLLGQTDVAARAAAEGAPAIDLLAPALHDAFNGLMLAQAGATGGNVYLRPTERALVGITASPRGVTIEYNAALAARLGPAALIGLLMHRLLHGELHPRSERVWRAEPKPGGRQELAWLGGYLPTVVDHVWLEPRLEARAPGVGAAFAAWGLDVALLLSGGESLLPDFVGARVRDEIARLSAQPDVTPESLRAWLLERLTDLCHAYFGLQREETNRFALAVILGDLRLRNPDAAGSLADGLEARETLNLREAQPLADRLHRELHDLRTAVVPTAPVDTNAFRNGLDAALKALNVHTYFDLRPVKSDGRA